MQEKSFYQTCHEAVASNKDVQITLQSLKEECLASANSGKAEITISIHHSSATHRAALKLLENKLPIIFRDTNSVTFSLI